MPRAGLEPARECPDDFKSSASTIPPPRLLELEPRLTDIVVNFKGIYGTLIQTSGSMGIPKKIFHSFEQHQIAARAVIANTKLDENSCSLVSLPMYHIGGFAIIVRAWASGGRWLVPDKGWTVDWAVNQQGVTHLSLVATQLKRMMQSPAELKALHCLKAILLGGSAIPKSLIEEAYREELPIITTYGSTETASQVTATCLGDSLDRLWTSGKCLPEREIQISPSGEIIVSGAMVCNTRHQTGDFGYLDSQGYLQVVGRIDNRFISGGENIYPEEIERALLENPQVDSVVVVAKPDLDYGQSSVVFVKMRAGFELDADSLQGFLRERIARFKVPKDWRLWPIDVPEGLKLSRAFFAKLVN